MARCASSWAMAVMGAAVLTTRGANAVIVQPPLNYSPVDLEPYISAETIEYHYGRHHAGYVTNINAFIEEDPSLEGLTIEEIMLVTDGTVFNNAGQVYNHNFYWESLSPTGGGEPTGAVKYAIEEAYGNFTEFKEVFSASAAGHFGSGWAWLIQTPDGSVSVVDTHDALNPIVEGTGTPLLTCDVWEHAYYIDYRNGRGDYIESWWELVNWDFANENMDSYSYDMSYAMSDSMF